MLVEIAATRSGFGCGVGSSTESPTPTSSSSAIASDSITQPPPRTRSAATRASPSRTCDGGTISGAERGGACTHARRSPTSRKLPR